MNHEPARWKGIALRYIGSLSKEKHRNKRYRERLKEIKELATKHLDLNLDMRADVILDIVNEELEADSERQFKKGLNKQ